MQKLNGADAVLAFVPYPFFVEHAAQLHLTPLVQADVADIGVQQRWTLVAKAGRVTAPASMAGFTILSTAGYAPDFVRHSALEAWALPADVKIEPTGQILSALRRVAAGEPVAVLLDQTQAAALASLPFATRAFGRDAVSGAAGRHHCGGRLPPGRGPRTGPADGAAQDGTRSRERRHVGAIAFARLRSAEAAHPGCRAVIRRILSGLSMLAVAACATPPPAATTPGACATEPSSVAELAAAIELDAQRSDHEPDSKVRRDSGRRGQRRRRCLHCARAAGSSLPVRARGRARTQCAGAPHARKRISRPACSMTWRAPNPRILTTTRPDPRACGRWC